MRNIISILTSLIFNSYYELKKKKQLNYHQRGGAAIIKRLNVDNILNYLITLCPTTKFTIAVRIKQSISILGILLKKLCGRIKKY